MTRPTITATEAVLQAGTTVAQYLSQARAILNERLDPTEDGTPFADALIPSSSPLSSKPKPPTSTPPFSATLSTKSPMPSVPLAITSLVPYVPNPHSTFA